VRLGAFLGRITRNAAFDRRRHALAIKRGGGERLAVLDELAECVSGGEGVEEETARRELAAAISAFLESLPREKRAIFVLRYWYGESVTDIAAKCHRKPNAVSTLLWRLRKAMKRYLTERGFDL
jgi:RNA polymerase sigma-70 factor (ECF subfamily)